MNWRLMFKAWTSPCDSMRACAASLSIFSLLALTRSELWSMRYSERPTSSVTMLARHRPASRVIFHWMESCRKGMGRPFFEGKGLALDLGWGSIPLLYRRPRFFLYSNIQFKFAGPRNTPPPGAFDICAPVLQSARFLSAATRKAKP
ncbi:hypothetical protein D3C73_1046720 [compost metagenome]